MDAPRITGELCPLIDHFPKQVSFLQRNNNVKMAADMADIALLMVTGKTTWQR